MNVFHSLKCMCNIDEMDVYLVALYTTSFLNELSLIFAPNIKVNKISLILQTFSTTPVKIFCY
jgi:hypothetical protein